MPAKKRTTKKSPASKASKERKQRVSKKTKSTKKRTSVKKPSAPRVISASVLRDRQQWRKIREAQTKNVDKVAVQPMRRLIRQAMKEIASHYTDDSICMQKGAERLLIEQGVQFVTEWMSEVQRFVEMNQREMPNDADLASGTYLIFRSIGLAAPPCQQPVNKKYNDYPKAALKGVAKNTTKAVANFDALELLSKEDGTECLKKSRKDSKLRRKKAAQRS